MTFEKEYSVIVPVYDEPLVGQTLDGLIGGLGSDLRAAGEVIIAADVRSPETVEIARAWAVDQNANEQPMESSVIDVTTVGKNRALNLGMAAARGEFIIVSDGDVTQEPGSIQWAVDHMARSPRTHLLGTVMVANTNPEYLPQDPDLAAVTILTRERWLSLAGPRRVSGNFMTFRANDEIRFPDTQVGDDTWLNPYIAARFGLDSIHTDRDHLTLVIAPQTWQDYLKMFARFSVAYHVLEAAHPELAEANQALNEHMVSFSDTESNMDEWRERCEAQGIDFGKTLQLYYQARERIKSLAPAILAQRMNMDGEWERISSTKTTPRAI